MTTTVTIKTHSWPVEVKTKDQNGERDYTVSTEVIPPESERVVYIHSTRSLKLTELPQPATQGEPA